MGFVTSFWRQIDIISPRRTEKQRGVLTTLICLRLAGSGKVRLTAGIGISIMKSLIIGSIVVWLREILQHILICDANMCCRNQCCVVGIGTGVGRRPPFCRSQSMSW